MRSGFLLIVALACSLASVEALTITPLRFTDLVAEADTIAYGRVSAVEGQWTSDRQSIESLVTVDVIDRFKGRGASTLTFRVPGGRAGHIVNVLPGMPTVREGDLVVLFLASRGPAIPMPVGLTQGVLHVGVDAQSGALLVGPPLGFGGETGTVVRGSASRAPIRLSQLADGIRTIAGAAR